MRRRLRGAPPAAVVAGLVAGAVAFGGSFLAARALTDGGGDGQAHGVRQLPERLVTINNLERAPSIKPLRSAAGTPPPATPATVAP